MDPWCTHQALSKVVNLHIVLHYALGILDAGCANHHVQEWGVDWSGHGKQPKLCRDWRAEWFHKRGENCDFFF